MAEAVVNIVLEQLISGAVEWVKEERSLLKGVETELINMTTKMQFVQTVLEDAENQCVKKKYVKIWLENLQDVSYDMDDVLDEWNTRLQILKREEAEENTSTEIVGSSSCLSLKQLNCFKSVKQVPWRRDIALRIKDINGRMNLVFAEMEQFKLVSKEVGNDGLSKIINHNDIPRTTTSFVDESKVYGRDEDKDFLLSKVLSVNAEQEQSVQVVSIVGVGGLGKTTLAQLVYNDTKVKEKFGKKRIWVCVSSPFDEVKVARAILEGLEVDHANMENLQTLHQSIEGSIFKHKFLLVLDDVWDEDFGKWERLSICLKVGDPDSRILVTTRKEEVVRTMGTTPSNILKPRLVSDLDCWLLIKQRALQERNNKDNDELEAIGKEIAKKCKGLPLAANTLGGLLISKDSIQEWREVLENEIWELEKVEIDLFPHIFLSYQELPSVLKRCFLILALFPKDTNFWIHDVVLLWMANGYVNTSTEQCDMVRMGYKYLKFLVSRAFLEDHGEYRVSMHDIMHDFALHLSRDELLSIVVDEDIGNGRSSKLGSKVGLKSTKVRHLIIKANINPTSIGFDFGKVRTCIINEVLPNVTLDLVKRLKMVRSLNLEMCGLQQVPESIGNLIHLRLLVLSDNPLVELPETIGDLYNLQQFWLEDIDSLSTMPQSLGKLINLVSLMPCDLAIEKVPEAVGKLINLQRLSRIYIGGGKRKLGFLKDLNELRELEIEFRSDYGDEVDAKKAAIGSKKYLISLSLYCYAGNVTDGVVAALQPHPNIKSLKLYGLLEPSWINSLHHLRDIRLHGGDATTLPPLWKLEFLEKIVICRFHCLKTIGREFLGIDNNPNKKFCAFPKLVELEFSYCSKLTRLEDLKEEEEGEGEMTVMPNLQILKFHKCHKLVEIPFRLLRQASSLKKLSIDMDTLVFDFDVEIFPEGVSGEVCLNRRFGDLNMSVRSSRTVPISIINRSYITILELFYQTERITELPPMGKLPYLESLTINGLSSLKLIGRDFLGIDNEEFVAFPYLVNLKISECDLLEGWEDLKPEDEGKIIVMPKLENLKITRCPKFQEMPPRLLLKLSSSLKVLHLPHDDN